MLANVLLKTLRDQGRLLVAWAVSLALIVATYAAVWPAVKSGGARDASLFRMAAISGRQEPQFVPALVAAQVCLKSRSQARPAFSMVVAPT